MSGKFIRIRLPDGDEYEMPEAEAFPAMFDLEKSGVKFEASEAPSVRGDVRIGNPEVIKTAPAPAAPDNALEELLAAGGDRLRTPTGRPMSLDNFIEDTASAVMPTARVLKGAGALPSAINQGISGGVQGAIRAYEDDPERNVWNALVAGKDAALGAGAVGLGLGAAGQLASGVGRAAGRAADSSRLKSWGATADDVAAHAEQYRLPQPDAVRDLVARGEGLVPPNKMFARSPGEWNSGFKTARQAQGRAVGSAIDQATAEGAQLPPDVRAQLAQNLYQRADAQMAAGRNDARQLGGALSNEALAVQNGPQFTSPHDVRAQKTAFDEAAYGGEPGSPESYAGKAAKSAADELRGVLSGYVGQGSPETARAFESANDAFGVARQLEKATYNAANRGDVSGGIGPKLVGALGGGIVGGMLGGMPGAAYGAAAGYTGRAIAGNPDAAANVMRLAQNGLGGAGSAMTAGAQSSGVGLASGQLAAAAGTQREQTERAQQESRGDLLPQALDAILQSQPEMLGSYARQLVEAKQHGTLSGVLYRLQQTDEGFRRNVLPLLQQYSAQMAQPGLAGSR